MCKAAQTNYYQSFIKNLRITEPRTWMKRMKNLGRGPDEVDNNQFHFPDENCKSDLQIADEIGDYFANISANFEPIDRN